MFGGKGGVKKEDLATVALPVPPSGFQGIGKNPDPG
jgi:hypothetical protein